MTGPAGVTVRCSSVARTPNPAHGMSLPALDQAPLCSRLDRVTGGSWQSACWAAAGGRFTRWGEGGSLAGGIRRRVAPRGACRCAGPEAGRLEANFTTMTRQLGSALAAERQRATGDARAEIGRVPRGERV